MAHADHAATAARPALEVADILCVCADVDGYDVAYPLSPQQHWVMTDLIRYRTAAFGAFSTRCDEWGMLTIQYASYRNRHHEGIALETLLAAVKKTNPGCALDDDARLTLVM